MTGLRQVQELNKHSRLHEELGNTLLASWLLESAKHFEELDRRTSRALDEMPLGVYVEERHSMRATFTEDWFEYEEEYAYNFFELE